MFDDELVPADLLLALTHAFGLMALCTLLFGRIQRGVRNATVRNCATGLVLGVATAIAMLQPFFTVNGFQVDGRNMFIAVAAAFGGVTAMIVAAVIGILMRIAIGGAGVPFGTGAILIICILGALWAHVTRKEGKRGWQSWVLLGALLSVPLLVGLNRAGFFGGRFRLVTRPWFQFPELHRSWPRLRRAGCSLWAREDGGC